jgi:hypothetical protein
MDKYKHEETTQVNDNLVQEKLAELQGQLDAKIREFEEKNEEQTTNLIAALTEKGKVEESLQEL